MKETTKKRILKQIPDHYKKYFSNRPEHHQIVVLWFFYAIFQEVMSYGRSY